jgi:plastocyanin
MKALATLALLSFLLLAGCGSPGAGPTAPPMDAEGRYVIEMTAGNKFSPASAEVPVGATVVWKHMGGAPHDVQAEDGSFSSGPMGGMSQGDEFEHTFTEAGTYAYHCHLHEGVSMRGTLTVA